MKYLRKNTLFIKRMVFSNIRPYIFITNMKPLEIIIFGKKKFSDLLEEIYVNQQKKSTQVTTLISELKPLIQEISDATLIVPLIKEYMEIGVKNDEQLIKMATIIQRITNNQSGGDSLVISDQEKEQLLQEMEKIQKNTEDA